MKKPILTIFLMLAVAFPVFGQDDCISVGNCPKMAYEGLPGVANEQDVKKAIELALKYLNPPNPLVEIIAKIEKMDGNFYPIYTPPETETEKLIRLAEESRVKAERLEQKAKDIRFIREVYEENF